MFSSRFCFLSSLNVASSVSPAELLTLVGWRDDMLLQHLIEDKENSCGREYVLSVKKEASSGVGSTRIFVSGEASSSFDVAQALLSKNVLAPWESVLVTSQTAGRGQLRRHWSSPCGNVYAAWRLPMEPPFTEAYAALVVGCVVAEGFQALGVPVRLKWPNDILLHDKKIGGILLEERDNVLVAGIGINVYSSPSTAELRQDFAVPTSSLREQGFSFTPLSLYCSLVEIGRFWYRNQVLRDGVSNFPLCAEKHLAWLGHEVRVHGSTGCDESGQIVGLSPCGGLKILSCGRERTVDSGSITPLSCTM